MITAEMLKKWMAMVPRCEDTCPRYCFSSGRCYDDRCGRYGAKVEAETLRREIEEEMEALNVRRSSRKLRSLGRNAYTVGRAVQRVG